MGPLTTAWWKGGQGNIWSILFGGAATQLDEIDFLNPTVNGLADPGNFSAVILSDGEIVAAVPEPRAWGMTLTGLVMLVGIQRWSRRSPRFKS